MTVQVKKSVQAGLLVIGFTLIWALSLLAGGWIYDRLAIRVAFGHWRVGGRAIAVTNIKKPYAVTFSNGVVADVGYLPAAAMDVVSLAGSVIGGGLYAYRFRRQIRALSE